MSWGTLVFSPCGELPFRPCTRSGSAPFRRSATSGSATEVKSLSSKLAVKKRVGEKGPGHPPAPIFVSAGTIARTATCTSSTQQGRSSPAWRLPTLPNSPNTVSPSSTLILLLRERRPSYLPLPAATAAPIRLTNKLRNWTRDPGWWFCNPM